MIGEAVKRIPDWARSQDLEMPWRDLAGMQNKLIRDRVNMDVKIIWQAILEDVPPLKMTIARVFEYLRNSLPSF